MKESAIFLPFPLNCTNSPESHLIVFHSLLLILTPLFCLVSGKKYLLNGPMGNLVCQFASLSSHGTACNEVFAQLFMSYFCGIQK